MARQEPTELKRRAYIADFRLQLDVLEAVGNLYPRTIPKDEEVRTNMACPTHGEAGAAVKMRQVYLCSIDDSREHGEWTSSECLRGRTVDSEFKLVDENAIKAAKEDSGLPDKVLTLVPHLADEIKPYLAQSGKSYLYEPTGASMFYPVLLEIMNEDGTIDTEAGRVYLVGQCLMKKEERMVVLGLWNGRITINEIERPERLVKLPKLEVAPAKETVIPLAKTLLATALQPFNPDDYVNAQIQRIKESLDSDSPTSSSPKAKVESTDSIELLLQASIQALQAKKV